MSEDLGIPIIYEENRIKVLNALRDGRIDYLDLTDWTFQDRIFCIFIRDKVFRDMRGQLSNTQEEGRGNIVVFIGM